MPNDEITNNSLIILSLPRLPPNGNRGEKNEKRGGELKEIKRPLQVEIN